MQFKRNQKILLGRVSLTVCTLILGASVAFAGSRKISPDLEGINVSGQVDVIVQFSQAPSEDYHQKVFRRGGTLKRSFERFKGGAYTMPASALEDLAADPDVVYISPDRPLRGASSSTTASAITTVNDYHPAAIDAPGVWSEGWNGSGIGVAVIDSGITSNLDLNLLKIAYNQDFTGASLGSASDQYGHGTHVTGILAGNGFSSTGLLNYYTFRGVAENVNLINLRVLDQNGAGTDSEVIAAIDEAVTLKSKYNIRVINLSLGRPVWESYKQDPLCQAVEQAWKAGIVVVVAAGNYGRDDNAGTNGYGTITAPGNDPYVITVGAMNTLGSLARTSAVPASHQTRSGGSGQSHHLHLQRRGDSE